MSQRRGQKRAKPVMVFVVVYPHQSDVSRQSPVPLFDCSFVGNTLITTNGSWFSIRKGAKSTCGTCPLDNMGQETFTLVLLLFASTYSQYF
jgi:hypothetical protein